MEFEADDDLVTLPLSKVGSLPGSVVLSTFKKNVHSFSASWFCPEFRLPPKLTDYIMCVVDDLGLGESESQVKHCALSIFKRFLSSLVKDLKPPSLDNPQVYGLASLLLASKFHGLRDVTERVTVSRIHSLSSHAFNNDQILGAQLDILSQLDRHGWDVLLPGVLIPDWIELLLCLTQNLVVSESLPALRCFCLCLGDLILSEDGILSRHRPPEIAIAVLFIATNSLSKSQHYFPMVRRSSQLLGVSMEDVMELATDLTENVLQQVPA